MKKAILLLMMVLGAGMCHAQQSQKQFGMHAVGFYNLENLFDTVHDYGKNDFDFLPNGSYKWNSMKYNHKL